MKDLFITCGFFLLHFFATPIFAQQKNLSLQHLAVKAKKMFTWDVKESPPHGYLMFLDVPYAIKKDPHNYISITVAKKYGRERPAFISFTLPGNILSKKGLSVIFSTNSAIQAESERFRVPFGEHWSNNHTFTARLRNGFLFNKNRTDSVDVFKRLMQNKQLFVFFYDSSGIERLAIPLIFFQRQYKKLLNHPTYSTGNPADTALTKEERKDKKVFEDGSIPTSWQTAGITNPIRFKHFIKYFSYLVDHNEKEKIAQLFVYPLKSVFPECRDSAQFVQNYEKIFGEYLKGLIDSVRLNELMRDQEGVWIGYGPNIAIRQTGNRYEIFMISNAAFFRVEGLPAPGLINKRK